VAIDAAIKTCHLLLETPAPVIECTSLQGDGNLFEIWFSVADTDRLANARTELFAQLHRHLRHAGIAPGIAGVAAVPRAAAFSPAELMARSDLFGGIADPQRDLIAQHLTEIQLLAGATLIEQGAIPTALFVIAAGALEITIQRPGEARHVAARMGPGETLGAVGLITGSPYAATATALTGVRAYKLDKAAVAAAIEQMPALRDGLEAVAELGQVALRRDVTAPENHAPAQPDMFRIKLRHFLSALGR
jgi:hypothetical protein